MLSTAGLRWPEIYIKRELEVKHAAYIVMTQTTKDLDIDFKESKVSDFFMPRFSYYSELIEKPRKDVGTWAKNSIFSALVANDRRKFDDQEEEKRPPETQFEVD